jgi:ABC-2 type transport system ATP-binding protein
LSRTILDTTVRGLKSSTVGLKEEAMTKGSGPAVRVEGLEKAYGKTRALRGLDLIAEAGSILGILGANGAGKTTTIRILATLLRPDAGRAEVAGFDVVRNRDEVRARIGLTGQYAAVDELLTGRENLDLVAALSHLDRRQRRDRVGELLERFDLAAVASRPLRTYSGGMRRRLDIAASLVAAPAVLFLDEPTTGLDPLSRQAMWGAIEQLAADGTAVLLTTQYMEEAERLAGRIVVVDGGRVIASGTAADLKAQVGGERVELRLARGSDLNLATRVVAPLGSGPVQVDPDFHRLTLPVATAELSLPSLIRALDGSGVRLDGLNLRQPSLDDAFIALTGKTVPVTALDMQEVQ